MARGLTSLNLNHLLPLVDFQKGGMSPRSSKLGRVLYVDSVNGLGANNGTIDDPISTLVLALAKLSSTADGHLNRDDTIVLLPGHTESIDSATELNISRTGVKIIGVGRGTRQPKLTVSTANTSTITVSAANVLIQNVHIQANFANIAALITVSATDLHLDQVRVSEASGSLDWVKVITPSANTDNLIDGLTLTNCTIIGATTDNDEIIETSGSIDRLTVANCYLAAGVATGEPIIGAATGKVFTHMLVVDNYFYRLNTTNTTAIAINSDGTCSGIIANNCIGHADTAGAIPITAAGARMFRNFSASTDAVQDLLLPVADDNT